MARPKKEQIDLMQKAKELKKEPHPISSLLKLLNDERKNPSGQNFNPFFNSKYARLLFLIDYCNGLSDNELNSFICGEYKKAGGGIKRLTQDLFKRNLIKKETKDKEVIVYNEEKKAIEKKDNAVISRNYIDFDKPTNSMFDLIVNNTPELNKSLQYALINTEENEFFGEFLKLEYIKATSEERLKQIEEVDKNALNNVPSFLGEQTNITNEFVFKAVRPDFYKKLKEDFDNYYLHYKVAPEYFPLIREDLLSLNKSIYVIIMREFLEERFHKLLLDNIRRPRYNFNEALVITRLNEIFKVVADNPEIFNATSGFILIANKYSKTPSFKFFGLNFVAMQTKEFEKYKQK